MDHLNDELSLYLDGELEAEARARVETHLSACAECRATLDGLRVMVRRAASLDDTPPARDLWPGIASRIADASTADVIPLAPRRRRISFSIPQLAAAAVALMALSAGAGFEMTRSGPLITVTPDGGRRPVVALASDARGLPPAYASYDTAIRLLEATLEARRSQLDTSTVRVVEQSLRVIDLAIQQARAALSQDPDNRYLNSHLQTALDRKLDVLRRVTALRVS